MQDSTYEQKCKNLSLALVTLTPVSHLEAYKKGKLSNEEIYHSYD
jgi:hypothetical protein